jgi:ATP-dependent Lhr-like helicase
MLGALLRHAARRDADRLHVSAGFLAGGPADASRDCAIVDASHPRERGLAPALPNVPLEPAAATDRWEQVYDRIAGRAAAHHGSFAKTRRFDAERR